MKHKTLTIFSCLMTVFGLLGSALGQEPMKLLIENQFQFADKQYKILSEHTGSDVMPKTYYAKTNKWETSNASWWCSGFFTGSLLYIYEQTKDAELLQDAEKRLVALKKEQFNKHTHDLGFMMYCSFGNAYRLTKKPEYKSIIDTSSSSLITRYRPHVQAIQSWDANSKLTCPVIIDNMMNLEMLCWASDNGGDPRYKEIAIKHANTTLKNHFRKDYSSFHVVDYNPLNGAVIKKITWQGANDSSAWSRGQAWGLYGYTMMYRFTKDKRYLQQAEHIANFILTNPNMPEDLVPYWDFNAPGIPNALRDASAAAVTASALLELGQYADKKRERYYVSKAAKMIRTLSSDKYRAKLGENGGFLLMHSVGAIPFHSEVDVPLSYADYYYLEALKRYKMWYLKKFNF